MHPLDGPLAKVDWAQQQIEALDSDSRALFGTDSYRVVPAEINHKTGQRVLRIQTSIDQLPPQWSVVVGEVIHDLRSALDQLVCALALLSDRARGETFCEDEKTSFPILLYGPRSRSRPRSSSRPKWSSQRLRYLRRSLRTRIQGLQPYKRRDLGPKSPLWLLSEMNNADKHRYIQIVAARSRSMSMVVSRQTDNRLWVDALRFKLGVRLIDGTKVGEVDPYGQEDVEVQRVIHPEIVFWEGCDAVKRQPVIRTLRTISDEVSRAVNLFRGEF